MTQADSKKDNSILENVKNILDKFPNTRGDDKLLIVAYWKYIDKLYALDMNFVNKATPAESITRARRLIQANGEYLASEEVRNARKKREETFKKALREGVII